jgi:hypothetical protein
LNVAEKYIRLKLTANRKFAIQTDILLLKYSLVSLKNIPSDTNEAKYEINFSACSLKPIVFTINFDKTITTGEDENAPNGNIISQNVPEKSGIASLHSSSSKTLSTI